MPNTANFTTPDVEVPRDRWQRPLIYPTPDTTKPLPYTRATTLAKTLDDANSLIQWKQRLTARGLLARPDLMASLAATDDDDKPGMNKIVDAAFEQAGGSAAATTGTAVHKFTERLDLGQPLGQVPNEYKADIEAYKALAETIGWKVLDVEKFLVNHEFQVAGTADRILEIDGQTYIADLKTGSSVDYHQAWSVQFAIYANSHPYNPGTRETLEWPYPPPRLDKALVIHLPAGKGEAHAYWVDITVGLDALKLATQVRDFRKSKLLTPYEKPRPVDLFALIAGAPDRDALIELWQQHKTDWTPEHNKAAATRTEQLQGETK